ncbi:MFS general substrate transporter [Penicillium soppii]|jgi:hypothetical protein|uniref:MFS general substrate transporter n=1 Tax=Penicillium soppii TaxID=69789 RepID=UPI0025484789|nr:MFS general substrate transporter [Penicillium soppii]KAJ5856526.1 MFS general substrate transporter [Penicillium soppii]
MTEKMKIPVNESLADSGSDEAEKTSKFADATFSAAEDNRGKYPTGWRLRSIKGNTSDSNSLVEDMGLSHPT